MGRKAAQSVPPAEEPVDQPPFFGSWPKIYFAVLSFLAFLIAAFYLFMKAFT